MTDQKAGRPSDGLVLEGLGHQYDGVSIFEGFSLTVAQGEVVCLLGPSGCGKSTILRLVAGLEGVQQGSIHIGGKVVSGPGIHIQPEDRNIGLVLQDFALFPHLTVRENVAFGVSHRNEDDGALVDQMLELVKLKQDAGKYPHMLSGGEQQRIALARALATRPFLMLMDEPFSGLDSQHRNQVRDDTLLILKQLTIPTLLVTHDPEEAMRLADRIVFMRVGGIVQTGTPARIYAEPVDESVVALFGRPNLIGGCVENGVVTTPLGIVEAPGFENGARVCVAVRPEALSLALKGDDSVITATVVRSRFLGNDWLVDFSVAGTQDIIQARLSAGPDASISNELMLVLDRQKAYVFATS